MMETLYSMRKVDYMKAVDPLEGLETPFVLTSGDRNDWLERLNGLPAVPKDDPNAVGLCAAAEIVRGLCPVRGGSAVITSEGKSELLRKLREAV